MTNPLAPRKIADSITKQLLRNESTRYAHWRNLGLKAPRKKVVE